MNKLQARWVIYQLINPANSLLTGTLGESTIKNLHCNILREFQQCNTKPQVAVLQTQRFCQCRDHPCIYWVAAWDSGTASLKTPRGWLSFRGSEACAEVMIDSLFIVSTSGSYIVERLGVDHSGTPRPSQVKSRYDQRAVANHPIPDMNRQIDSLHFSGYYLLTSTNIN